MASAGTHTGPSASSTSIHRPKYEVFLSFRGADTRHGFTDHLYAALKRKRIIVFRDDEELERGEEIHPGLKDAIKASQYAVIVISEKFAESKSCLFELSAIMECRRMGHLTVFPVFYKVDPFEVKNQAGHFGEAFAKLENDPKVGTAKWETWKAILNEIGNCSVDFAKVDENPLNSCRDALKKVGKLSGWHLKDRPEAKVVEEISLKILRGLIRNLPNIPRTLVGIESQATEVLKLLDVEAYDAEAENVGVIGICGMGGVGKTTLAKVIYDRVSSQFEARCFIYIKEDGIVNLQRKLLSNILSPEIAYSLRDDFEVAEALHYRLRNIKVFIVLDNVDSEEQAETLVGNRAWFGGGSRIILTSRDNRLLKLFDANIYIVKELKPDDALQLFSLKAFKKALPEKNFEELSTTFVEYAKGLPLALKVFGSFLYCRPKDQWEFYKDKLQGCLDEKILRILQISFKGLESLQKELFLDVAYFFNGFSKRTITPVLKSFGFKQIDLEVLKEKSLLNITENGELLMHDLLVKMGQDLECQRDHLKCKRLWRSEDIIQGSGMIGAIVLNSAKEEALCFNTLSNMKYLRMLKILYPCSDFEGAVWYGNHLESKLTHNFRVLEWLKFPFLSLSSGFGPQNHVELKLPGGSTELLQFEFERFHALTQIELSESENLIKRSSFQRVQNLEIQDLSSHENLIQVDSSLGFPSQIRRVELHFCSMFGRSANLGQSTSKMLNLFDCRLPYEEFSSEIGGLHSLKSLLQRWKKFTKIPDGVSQLFDLEELQLGSDGISQLFDLEELHLEEVDWHEIPSWSLSSIWLLSDLRGLQLIECTFQPRVLRQLDLTSVYLSDKVIPYEINCLSSLTHLSLSGYLTRLPSSLHQLSKLRRLILCCLTKLNALPKLPMRLSTLDLFYCPSLEMTSYIPMNTWNSSAISRSIHSSVLVGGIGYDGKPYKILLLHPQCSLWSTFGESEIEDRIACGHVLEARIPKWFSERSTNFSGIFRSPIYLDLDDYLKDWMGCALCIICQVDDNSSFPILACELEVDGYGVGVPLVFCVPELLSVGVHAAWVFIPAAWFNKQLKTLNTGGILRASIATKSLNVRLNSCWTRLVWEHDVSGFYDALRSIYARRVDLHSIQELFSNLGTLFVLGPIKEKPFWLDGDDVIKKRQLEMPTCSNLILDQSWSSIPLERCLYLERASPLEDLTFEENQLILLDDHGIAKTQELDMPACLDLLPGQSPGSIHLRRCLYPEGDSTFEENQPKRPMELPRHEHLEMAELTYRDRSHYRVRRCFRVQRRRQVKRRRRDLLLQRDPSVGRRNEFVSSGKFLRPRFFLHGRRNSVAAVCLLLTAFALLVFPS